MSVYVDNMRCAYRGMIMSHMLADSHAELLAMADKIGVQRKWIQKSGTVTEHFDICQSKKQLAIANGAIEINFRRVAEIISERRNKI